jgi:hypothetical protein
VPVFLIKLKGEYKRVHRLHIPRMAPPLLKKIMKSKKNRNKSRKKTGNNIKILKADSLRITLYADGTKKTCIRNLIYAEGSPEELKQMGGINGFINCRFED